MARRLVRQDTPLWSALHRGCLTGGHLNAALGFYEPACARKLGMPTSFVGHQRLLAAYGNLLKRPHGALSDVLAAPAVHTGSAAAGSSRHQAPAVANKRKDATKVRRARHSAMGPQQALWSSDSFQLGWLCGRRARRSRLRRPPVAARRRRRAAALPTATSAASAACCSRLRVWCSHRALQKHSSLNGRNALCTATVFFSYHIMCALALSHKVAPLRNTHGSP